MQKSLNLQGSHRPLTALKRILKILGYILSAFLLLILGFLLYFFLNKDEITKNLLLSINSHTQGELQVGEVQINPFVHFPKASLTLKEASLYGQDSIEDQIISLSRLHVSLDLLELLRSRIEVVEISMEDGSLHLIQHADSSLNLINALHIAEADEGLSQEVSQDSAGAEIEDLSLSVKEIKIKNLEVNLYIEGGELRQAIIIDRAKANLDYHTDKLRCQLESGLRIRSLEISESLKLHDEELDTELSFQFLPETEELRIEQCKLLFRNAHFQVDGLIQWQDETSLDLTFDVADDKLQFTRLFLTSEGIDHLNSGGLYFQGSARGSMEGQIPEIEARFGARELKVRWPDFPEDEFILSMEGAFSSGNTQDLADARLEVDTFSALLPDGYVRGAARLDNFNAPEYYYHIDASLELNGLEDIIDLGPVSDLKGRLRFRDEYRGLFSEDGTHTDLCDLPFHLEMDSISFRFGDLLQVDHLGGSLSGTSDSLKLSDLHLVAEQSDVLLNGAFYDFPHFLYDRDKAVSAELSLQSNHLDFSQLFAKLPDLSEKFPYKGKELSLSMSCETSYNRLFEFTKFPELQVENLQFSGSIDSLFPNLSLDQGRIELLETQHSAILEIQALNLKMDESHAAVSGALKLNEAGPDSILLQLHSEGIRASSFLGYWMDSIPDFLEAEFTGQLSGHLAWPADSFLLFSSAGLQLENFQYSGQDSASVDKLELQSRDIALNTQPEIHLLASLSASSELIIDNLQSPDFQSGSMNLQVEIAEGVYTLLIPQYFYGGQNVQGRIDVSPFEESPYFDLYYKVEDLKLEELLESFNQEKLIEGKVNLELDLDAQGSSVTEITSSTSGSISLEGDSLVLEGLDLNEVINNFRRSQSFNLLDITAIALAGPAGILYSKGSDYAILLSTTSGQETSISQISSIWDVKDGRINIEDVAIATQENRLALKGWMDMKTDSLDIVVGIIDAKGCALIDQRIFGTSSEPELGQVKILQALLSPLTSLLDDVTARDCEVFYEGRVKHPEASEKN